MELITLLKNRKILYADNVVQIRQGLNGLYPNISHKERAVLFSKAIHKILDRNLNPFDQELAKQLKQLLLKKVILQEDVDLTAYDIIESYIQLEKDFNQQLLIEWFKTQEVEDIEKIELDTIYKYFTGVACTDEGSILHAPQSLDAREVCEYEEEVATCEQIDIEISKEKSSIGQSIGRMTSGVAIALAMTVLVTTASLSQEEVTYVTMEAFEEWFKEERVRIPIVLDDHLQPHLQYKEIDEHALKVFLLGRDSLLAQDIYFDSIMQAAQEFYINPLLMFAITGQEQGFVKADHPRAEEIANNPFNVFGSWQDFNTNILDTSRIAARTIVNLSEGCPADEDPIEWLNKRYAEDPNWHKGVTSIFNMLEDIAGTPRE